MLQDRLDLSPQILENALQRLVSGIPPRPDPDTAPLSFTQERLWFLSLLEPGSPAHQHALALHLTGPLDRSALQRALEMLIQRHEALRAALCTQDGRPWQAILPFNAFNLALPFIDFSDLNPQVAHARTQIAIEEDARRVFDLCASSNPAVPLLRAALYRQGHRQHVLYLSVPAFVADAASLRILAPELGELYNQIGQGRRPALSPLAAQHPDYAVWQRGYNFGADTASFLEHLNGAAAWLTLAGFSHARLDRPTGAPWRAVQESQDLPARLVTALRALAAAEDVPLETVLLAGFACLLHSRTGEPDFLIGLPAAGRARSDLAGCVGPFCDHLPLRAVPGEAASFRACVQQIQQSLRVTRSFAHLPFARLLSAAHLPRRLGETPLFQAVFALDESAPTPMLLAGDLRCELQPLPGSAAVYDLALDLGPSAAEAGGLAARLRCRARLFDAQSAAAVLSDYAALLELVTADPDLPLLALAGAPHPRESAPRLPLPAVVLPGPQPARGPMEAALAEMWEEVLALPALPGVETSFFDLGGDSLLAVHLLERIRAGWGQKLPLALLFQTPTVAALAAALHERLAVHGSTLIPLQPDGESLPFFCVAAPDKLPALAALARALGPGRPVYALQDSAPKRPALAAAADAEAAAARFDAALRVVQPRGPYLLGGVGLGGPAALELARRIQAGGEKVALLALVDSQAPPERKLNWLLRLFRAALPRTAPYNGPTLLLRSKPRALLAGDPALGWGRVSAAVDIRSVPIARADLLAETHAPTLAAILRPALDAAGE